MSSWKKAVLWLSTLGAVVFLALVLAVAYLPPVRALAGKAKKSVIEFLYAVQGKPSVKVVVKTLPPPLPQKLEPSRRVDTNTLFNGIEIASEVSTEVGAVASRERGEPNSYQVQLQVNVTIPQANATVAELASLNAHLPRQLPFLEPLLESGRVSPFFHALYQRKIVRIQSHAAALHRLLSRHNFFDCETIVELQNPASGRKALLIQGEMDVVSDGSDSDRTTTIDGTTDNYQPFTSYGWPKRTQIPNPFMELRQRWLEETKEELAKPGLSAANKKALESKKERLVREVADLKSRSYLIAQYDPFIVIPSFMFRYPTEEFGPSVGDYAVVIYRDRILPAIVGDAGPSFKMGEASLRLCQELNPRATSYSRPVSDLHVTYLVFPGSRDKPFAPPDYALWKQRCEELLEEMGGLGEGYLLHEWEDLLAPTETAPRPVEE